MQKLKISDEVVVISGKNKGRIGLVSKVNVKSQEVIVKGINVVKKNIKPSQQNPTGGIVDKEMPLHWSKVAILSPKTRKPTRVQIKVVDGKSVRIAAACGSVLDKVVNKK